MVSLATSKERRLTTAVVCPASPGGTFFNNPMQPIFSAVSAEIRLTFAATRASDARDLNLASETRLYLFELGAGVQLDCQFLEGVKQLEALLLRHCFLVGLVKVTAEGARVMRSSLKCSLVDVMDVTVAFMTGH